MVTERTLSPLLLILHSWLSTSVLKCAHPSVVGNLIPFHFCEIMPELPALDRHLAVYRFTAACTCRKLIQNGVTHWSWWCLLPALPWCPGRSHLPMSCRDLASGNACVHRCRLASTCDHGHRWFSPHLARWGFPQFVCAEKYNNETQSEWNKKNASKLTAALIHGARSYHFSLVIF